MKRFIAAASVAALAVIGLAGCQTSVSDEKDAGHGDSLATVKSDGYIIDLYETHVHLSDGRDVTCVTAVGYDKGGVSCDWVGASK